MSRPPLRLFRPEDPAPAPPPSASARRPRWLAAWLPTFRLERCGFDADEPAGLVAVSKGTTRVVVATPAAADHGIGPGMPAAEARARLPEVVLVEVDEAGERRDRTALLRALEAVSDRVAFWWEDAVVLELTDVLGRGDAATAERAAAARTGALLAGFGHRARLAVASDPLAACALAISGPVGEAPAVASLGGDLARVPLAALRPTAALAEAWAAVGLRTLGDLAGLDRASVVARYGREGLVAHRVARGETAAVGAGVRLDADDPAALRLAAPLAGATTRGELAFVLPGLLAELSGRLAARDLAVVRLRLVLVLEGGARRTVAVRVGRPTRAVARLDRAIRGRLDALIRRGDPASELPPTPIEELRLELEEAAPEVAWQPGLTERREVGEPLPDLVARLADQLGEAAVVTPALRAAWRPEATWGPSGAPGGPERRPDVVDALEGREGDFPCPRPSLLLDPPERIEVTEDPADGSPLAVRLPLAASGVPRLLPVTRRAGPERLAGEWWRAAALDRVYWGVALEGRAAWIFRAADGLWWLHGWFD